MKLFSITLHHRLGHDIAFFARWESLAGMALQMEYGHYDIREIKEHPASIDNGQLSLWCDQKQEIRDQFKLPFTSQGKTDFNRPCDKPGCALCLNHPGDHKFSDQEVRVDAVHEDGARWSGPRSMIPAGYTEDKFPSSLGDPCND